jgi:hypothetical protein
MCTKRQDGGEEQEGGKPPFLFHQNPPKRLPEISKQPFLFAY